MRINDSDEIVEKIKTHTLCSIIFFPQKNRALNEILWKNTVEPGRPQMTIWRMLIECLIPKTTNPHSEYVTRIAFSWKQWLQERASFLCYTYFAL
jgi:hypothetical protein